MVTKSSMFILVLTVMSANSVFAQLVSTSQELESALSAAEPGTEIILKNQVWTDLVVNINATGTADEPVIVRAENPGAVFLEGNSSVNMGGSYIIFEGVIFRNAAGLVSSGGRIDHLIEFRSNGDKCNHCTLTNITIDRYNGTEEQASDVFKWVYLEGQYNEVSFSSFIGKYGVGSIINDNRGNGEANYIKIHHNYFGERTPVGQVNALNDQDAIRIGTSTTSMSDSYSQVYDNYFNNWFGEIEIISNKSGSNKYYNNTFRNYSGTLTLRHGNNCEVFNNYFFAEKNFYSGGVRVIGEGHIVFNNYIEGINSKKPGGSTSGATGGINITNGRVDSELNGYFQVIDATIINNTFVDCDYGIRVGTKVSSDLSLPPTDLDISNNIMLNSSTKAISETTAPVTSVYSGNITQNGTWDILTGTNGNKESVSGLLEAGTEFYRLVAGSEAIDAGLGSYDYLLEDILGGFRPVDFDAGAEEFEAGGTKVPYNDSDIGVTVGFGASDGGSDPAIITSVSMLDFEDAAAQQEFYVFSNVSWTVSSDASWLTVSPTSGFNSGAITAEVSANTSTSARSGEITIRQDGGDLVSTISVTQTPNYGDAIGATQISVVGIDANGTQDTNLPEYTLDKNHSTWWTGESTDGSSFIRYDLSKRYDIAAVRIMFLNGADQTYSFKVKVSDGNTESTTDLMTSTGLTEAFENFEFDPRLTGARYVTIEGYGNSANTGLNSYVEVEIYGEASTVLSVEDEGTLADGIVVYPNPVSEGTLTLKSDPGFIEHVQVFSTQGILVHEARPNRKVVELNVQHLTSGVYIIHVLGAMNRKILIRHYK